MIIRLNLLPHRERRRQEALHRLKLAALATLGAAGLVVLLAHLTIANLIAVQHGRNAFLEAETKKLDTQIREIARLKEQKAALLARKDIIERLEDNRAQPVRLLDELVRRMPEGVSLRQIKQSGGTINLQGVAQSNARVAGLIRNLESSALLATPNLLETKAAAEGAHLLEFSLDVKLKGHEPPPAAPKAGDEP